MDFVNILGNFLNLFVKFNKLIKNAILSWGPVFVTGIAIIIHQTRFVFAYSYEMVKTALAKLETVTENADQSFNVAQSFDGLLTGANTFIPVDFILSAIAVYGSLVIAASIVRIIKSCIPTVAS